MYTYGATLYTNYNYVYKIWYVYVSGAFYMKKECIHFIVYVLGIK